MEKYVKAKMEIVLFDTEDVIATSGLNDGGRDNPDEGEDFQW